MGRSAGPVGRALALGSAAATIPFALLVGAAAFEDLPGGPLVASLAFALGVASFWRPWRRRARSWGPKHTLDAVLLCLGFVHLILLIDASLGLPTGAWVVWWYVAGGVGAGIWLADVGLETAAATGHRVGARERTHVAAGLAGPASGLSLALWVLGGAAWVAPTAAGLLLASSLAAFRLVRSIRDPHRPGPHPAAALMPWRAADGRRLPLPSRTWARFPGTLTYSVVAAALYVAYDRQFRSRGANVESSTLAFGSVELPLSYFAYQIPLLLSDIPKTLVNLFTAVWLNPSPIQLVYVLVLLGLFGAWYEVREGTRRAAFVFWTTSVGASILAGALLHLARATLDLAWIELAWQRSWAGGSVGAFGLMGAVAARARRPGPLLGFFFFWEFNVEVWFLRSYTVAFHMIALALGFWLGRTVLRDGRRRRSERSPAASSGAR